MSEPEAAYIIATGAGRNGQPPQPAPDPRHVHGYSTGQQGVPAYAEDLETVLDVVRKIDTERRAHAAKCAAWEALGREILANGYEAMRHGKKMRELIG